MSECVPASIKAQNVQILVYVLPCCFKNSCYCALYVNTSLQSPWSTVARVVEEIKNTVIVRAEGRKTAGCDGCQSSDHNQGHSRFRQFNMQTETAVYLRMVIECPATL